MQIIIRTVNPEELPPGTKIGMFKADSIGQIFKIPSMAIGFIKATKPTVELSLDLTPYFSSTGYYRLE